VVQNANFRRIWQIHSHSADVWYSGAAEMRILWKTHCSALCSALYHTSAEHIPVEDALQRAVPHICRMRMYLEDAAECIETAVLRKMCVTLFLSFILDVCDTLSFFHSRCVWRMYQDGTAMHHTMSLQHTGAYCTLSLQHTGAYCTLSLQHTGAYCTLCDALQYAPVCCSDILRCIPVPAIVCRRSGHRMRMYLEDAAESICKMRRKKERVSHTSHAILIQTSHTSRTKERKSVTHIFRNTHSNHTHI